MDLPIIITNFKTYESATGENALNLAKVHEKIAKETGVNIGVAVQAMDLRMVASAVEIPVFAQHIDPIVYGSNTGHILPEAAAKAGAVGTLLNHSERRIDNIEESIIRAKEAGLYVIVCAESEEEGEKISKFNPDLIAVEPPELIGGDISVSTANPEIIKESVARIGEGKVLVGAGVKTGNDVKIANDLGASGILLASGITKAQNPEEVLRDLVSGL